MPRIDLEKCPVRGCNKHVRTGKLLQHIRQKHTAAGNAVQREQGVRGAALRRGKKRRSSWLTTIM